MIKLNEVTWYSKLAAIIFFLGIFPLLTFYLGMQYGIVLELQKQAGQTLVIAVPLPTPPGPTDILYTMTPTNDPLFTYPQITSFKDVEIMERVNQKIAETFGQAGCGPDTSDETFEWNVVTAVDYAQNNIFSVNASGNYFCGGANPTNSYSQTLTFDMTTGELVAFPLLFESFEIDQESILETIYAAQISLAEMTADIAQEGSCSTVNSLETLLNYTHDYRLATTSQSVVIRPQYPHVIEACAESVTVPVEQLLPFAPSDSLLYRL